MTRLLTLILCALTISAQAVDRYINPAAVSSGDGTTWAQAYTGFSAINQANLNPGDTVWMAAGPYGAINITRSGTIGARISFVRATVANHGTSTGWNNSMDGQAYSSLTYGAGFAVFRMDGQDYITINGQAWPGFRINFPVPTIDTGSQTASQVFGVHSVGNSNIVQYVEFAGPSVPSANTGVAAGDNNAFGRKTFFWLNHCYFHGLTVNSQLGDTDQMLIEQNEFGLVFGNSFNHDNSIYYFGLNDNGEIKNSYFHDNCAVSISITALRPPGPNHVKIYGNVWWGTRNVFHFDANQGPAWQLGGDYQIYNNTFVNCTDIFRVDSRFSPTFAYSVTGGFASNNIVWNATSFSQGPMLHDYNFNDGSLFSEPHGITSGLNPFVNLVGGDLHIVATIGAKYPRGKGDSIVAAGVSPDKDGVIRGNPPSIGAYEFPVASPGSIDFTSSTASQSETVTPLIVQVQRSSGLSGAVSAAYATADGTAIAGVNYTQQSGTLFWPNGDSSTKTISIQLINASTLGTKTFSIALSSPTGGSVLGNPSTLTATIVGAGAPPVTPINNIPADNAAGVSITPTCSIVSYSDPGGRAQTGFEGRIWDASGTILIYDVSLGAVASFPVPAGKLSYDTTYLFDARVQNSLTLWSGFSARTRFTTLNGLPQASTNIAPSNGATGLSLTPNLTLSAFVGVSPWDGSQFQVISGNSVVWDSNQLGPVATTTVGPNALAAGASYLWQGRFHNPVGWGPWSDRTSFTTAPAPQTPVNVSPAMNEVNVSTTPALQLSSYFSGLPQTDAQIVVTFGGGIAWNSGSLGPTNKAVVPFGILSGGQTCGWMGRFRNIQGWGGFSPGTSFSTTNAIVPPPPIIPTNATLVLIIQNPSSVVIQGGTIVTNHVP